MRYPTTIRLPKNEENWTSVHADRAIADAQRKFERYERLVDFEAPREDQDDLYRPYQLARELAVQVAHYVGWRRGEADSLP